MHKKSSRKTKTGLFTFATSNRIKAFIFAVFLVTANLFSLYSAALTMAAQAATPPQPPKSPSQPANGSVPNNGNNPITNPGQLNNLGNALNGTAGQNAQLDSLVQQAAEQEVESYQNIDDNLNSSLATTGANTSSGSATISSYLQSIQNNVASFLNTSTSQGFTSGGIAGQVFEGMQAIIYYTVGGGWIPKLGWIIAEYTQEFVSDWIGPPIGNFLINRMVAFKDSPDVSFQNDTFSQQMRTLNHLVRDFSYDLLLLFFILGIWRYWNNSVWGNGNLWGAIGRIVAATALVIAWPKFITTPFLSQTRPMMFSFRTCHQLIKSERPLLAISLMRSNFRLLIKPA